MMASSWMKCICNDYFKRNLCTTSLKLKLVNVRDMTMSENNIPSLNKPTAGIIIIGDEIIKGQVRDSNSNFLCNQLHKLGVRVERVSTIRDDVDVIAKETELFAQNYKYVLTSGGIGPTHDDVTYEGIAKAFGESLHIHPKLEELVKTFFHNVSSESPAFRFAKVPASAQLHFIADEVKGTKNVFPVISVRNVFIFPGVPELLVKAFNHVGEALFCNLAFQPHLREVFMTERELEITPVLNEAVDIFKNDVIFGSYPEFRHPYYKVRITMESQASEPLTRAEKYFQQKLPSGVIINYDRLPAINTLDKLRRFLSTSENQVLVERVRHSISILEDCFQKYDLSEMCLSFNGGKDCTALLHLVHAVLQERSLKQKKSPLTTLYIRDESPFPELEKFIRESSVRYDLNLFVMSGSIKESLTQMKLSHPKIAAAIMGTRRTDPHSENLKAFQDTDPDWPKYVRVSPILEWTYRDIWDFIRALYLPYCNLYDQGYTSIGNMEDTSPNPSLKVVDVRGNIHYRPAYKLMEEQDERNGRPC